MEGGSHRQTPGRSCSHGVAETFELMPENLSIQEEEGGERLVLRGGRHLAIDREVRKELDGLGLETLGCVE